MTPIALAALGCRAPGSGGPNVELVHVEDGRSALADAGVLFTTFLVDGPSNALVVDGDGQIRWSFSAPPGQRVLRAKRARDGTVLLGLFRPGHDDEDGVILRVDLDGNVLSETVAPALHHDFVEREDGAFVFLGHVFAEVEVEGHGVLPLATDTVRVASEGGESEVVFDFLADYATDPYWTCDHMEEGAYIEAFNEWTHTNSIVPLADGGWLLMARYLDAVVALDADFAPTWQLGGRVGDLDTVGEPLFLHAHMSEAQGDRLLVFDNGWNHPTPPPSRVVEIAVDPVAGTARNVWTYVEPDGEGTSFLGDAKRLPNGNVLVGWGGMERVTEVTPGGDVVWALEVDRAVGRTDLWEGALP